MAPTDSRGATSALPADHLYACVKAYLNVMGLLLFLLGLALLAWYWSDSLRAREQVLRACAQACDQHNVQFLDQTVALVRIRAARLPSGMLALHRRYHFEFSVDGGDRYGGEASILGTRVLSVHLHDPRLS